MTFVDLGCAANGLENGQFCGYINKESTLSYLGISKANVFPQLGVVQEIALLFPHATQ